MFETQFICWHDCDLISDKISCITSTIIFEHKVPAGIWSKPHPENLFSLSEIFQ